MEACEHWPTRSLLPLLLVDCFRCSRWLDERHRRHAIWSEPLYAIGRARDRKPPTPEQRGLPRLGDFISRPGCNAPAYTGSRGPSVVMSRYKYSVSSRNRRPAASGSPSSSGGIDGTSTAPLTINAAAMIALACASDESMVTPALFWCSRSASTPIVTRRADRR